jgi:hypothetical protein
VTHFPATLFGKTVQLFAWVNDMGMIRMFK